MTTAINRMRELIKTTKRPASAGKKRISAQSLDAERFYKLVEKKAYELFEKRGCIHGQDLEDWFLAESLVEEELSK